MKTEYLLILLVSIAVPFVKSFSKELSFYKYPARLFTALSVPFILFVLWDVFATGRGHWYFNDKYVTGIKFINLPIEEVLFFLVIPFCALFTWEVVKYFMRKSP